MSENETQDFQPRSVMAILPEVRHGKLVEEFTAELADLIQHVITHQKAGELNLKLKVLPGKHAMNAVDIYDQLAVKAPKKSPVPTIFFSDEEGSATRNDPNQPELALKPVRGKVQSIKEA